ncbi:MAG: Protein translocase subunit SecA, partial [Parcubacteria group bacterium GW2011_GWC1_40_13]
VATLPAYLNALTGKGVHIITVNDYLSRRDAVWMGQIYSFLGLSVGILNHDQSFLYDPKHKELDEERDELGAFKVVHEFLRPCSRQEAYRADITYGTNNEYGFDYLRDNIEHIVNDIRQREYNYAIVDEVDSILIDEARTPLIISMPTVDSENLYGTFAAIARNLQKDTDYKVDEKFKQITLTDEGINKAEKALGVENIYTDKGVKYVHHLETAVRAKALFNRDKEYVVRDGEVIIVDEFTGRLQPGRRWSEGLHQAVEAKEGVEVQKESRTFASITFQNYFRLYKKLAGMTGTALTSGEEFYKVYGTDTVAVPTNKPIARKDHNDLIFQNENGKFKALAREVKEMHDRGQPVLIGTVSIEKNEVLSEYLSREGIPHNILNAKNHEKEGEIIAQAGKLGGVTVATNMAGRGVDIKLGGVPFDQGNYEKVKGLGGLVVIGTERHEARRIDNQLRGRAGRQGDPGETQFYVSLEDTLMRVFASEMIKKMMGRFGIAEDEPIQNYLITRSLEKAQEKIEGFNFDARKHVLEYDDILNHQRKIVYERRRKILLGVRKDIEEKLAEMFEDDEIRKILDDKKALLGEDEFYSALRRLLLQAIDMFWVEHLEMMDYTRSSVNLRAYGQRDPLVEYKKEGLRLFKEMEFAIREEIARLVPHIGAGMFLKEEEKLKEMEKNVTLVGGGENKADNNSNPKNSALKSPTNEEGDKIGRNDPCVCGSGKKYKKCHGR